MATVDALWVCFISALGVSARLCAVHAGVHIYISAWASALLVQLYRAMRRPLCVGRATGTDSRAFFVYVQIEINIFFVRGGGKG